MAAGEPTPVGARRVIYEDGTHEAPVYDRAALTQGHRISGPAVIEEPASATLIRPGGRVRVDKYGNLLLGEVATG